MYEYRTLKTVKVIFRRVRGKRESNEDDEPNWGMLHACMEMSQQNPLYSYYTLIKMFKTKATWTT
jgi:uncharacterized membrane protein YgaE (UPF0421/DUF939 family)